jgi:hypothetical protein
MAAPDPMHIPVAWIECSSQPVFISLFRIVLATKHTLARLSSDCHPGNNPRFTLDVEFRESSGSKPARWAV